MKSRSVRLIGHIAGMMELRNADNFSIKTPEGKRSLGGPKLAWEDNIKMYRI
jgi:hypothetical protein